MNKKGVEYDEQNIYKILGAEWFQKVVFFLEKVKFQIIDILPINLCSLITKYYDKKWQE